MEPIGDLPGDRDPKADNEFWELVRGESDAEPVLLWDELRRRGWEPPDPDTLNEQELARALERLVLDLSWVHVYLVHTEHLSDPALYRELYEIARHEGMRVYPDDPESAMTIGFVGGGSDQELDAYLRYYADDDERKWWREQYPAMWMPMREPLPYPRDWIPERPD